MSTAPAQPAARAVDVTLGDTDYRGWTWYDYNGDLTVMTFADGAASAAHRAHAHQVGKKFRTSLDYTSDKNGRRCLITTWKSRG